MEAGLSDRASKVLRAVLHEKAGMDLADLRKQGIVTKVRTLKTGETVGGIPFTRGRSPTCFAIASTRATTIMYSQ